MRTSRTTPTRPAPAFRRVLAASALVLAVLSAAGCSRKDGGPAPAEGSALAAVDGLEVKGRAPKAGYDREKFGRAWADVDGNGCGTRVISMARRVFEMSVQLMQGVVSCAH